MTQLFLVSSHKKKKKNQISEKKKYMLALLFTESATYKVL